jgi:squalene-hopene/tetraprenyl-beta-curcumene cyclase
MSAWSRTIVVPVSVVNAFQAGDENLPDHLGVRELFLDAPETRPGPLKPAAEAVLVGEPVLEVSIALLKKFERWQSADAAFRRWALRKAVRWMRERSHDSDGIGAIFPPIDLSPSSYSSAWGCRTPTRNTAG